MPLNKRGLAEEVASYKTRFLQVAPLQTSVNVGRQEDKQIVVPPDCTCMTIEFITEKAGRPALARHTLQVPKV